MKADTREAYRRKILEVLIHIQNHLDDPLSLDDLASVAILSPYHFHRVFRGMVGEGVKEHVRRLRLERAALQLTGTRRDVTRIALEAGYETHESFTRAFRAMFGETPSGFRKLRGWAGGWKTPHRVRYTPGGLKDFFPNDTGGEFMEARIETMPPKKVAFVRHTGPYPEVGAAWGKLCGWAGPRGLLGPSTVFIGLCHDDPEVTPPEKIRYDACIEVSGEVVPEGEVSLQELSGGDYAVTVHKGPYDTLKDCYARLCGEWVPARGREIRSAPSLEFYLNDPDSTPSDELLTEVHVPLES